jgi:hypothetical protein
MNTAASMHRDDMAFVDESGDHILTSIDEAYPRFVMCFCIVQNTAYTDAIVPRIKRLEFDTSGHDCVVLHEIDIRRKRGAFRSSARTPAKPFWKPSRRSSRTSR